MNVGIIGGTGPAGKALACRLAANGTEVLVGSRSQERAAEIVGELLSAWPDRKLALTGVDNAVAAQASIIVLATPWDAALSTVVDLREALEDKVLISMVNAITRIGREFQPLIPARGSVAATVQSVLPKTRVAAAFQHLPAGDFGALDVEINADVLICSDDETAAKQTIALVESIPGLRAFNAGSLASANAIEALTAALLNINIRHRTHLAVRLAELGAKDDRP